MLTEHKTEISWLGHAGFRFVMGGKQVYIDPFKLFEKEYPKADYILITHGHFDHCSIGDLKKVSDASTRIFTTHDCVSKLSGKVHAKQVTLVEPGFQVELDGMTIIAVPAYNKNKE